LASWARSGRQPGRIRLATWAQSGRKLHNDYAESAPVRPLPKMANLAPRLFTITETSTKGGRLTVKRYNTPVRLNPPAMTIDETTGAAILTVTMKRRGPRQGETYRLLVDVEDFSMLSALTWTPMYQKDRGRCCDGRENHNKDHIYFTTMIRQSDGKYKLTQMQRLIMGSPHGKLVGFRHHNFMDLRKSQLYVGSQKDVNQRMRKTVKPTISQYRGVSFESCGNGQRRWIAQASVNNKVRKIKKVTANNPNGELICAQAYDCFVLANFENPNPNFRASSYSDKEITAYKLDRNGKRISPSVLSVMPSATTRRTGLLPEWQSVTGERKPVSSATWKRLGLSNVRISA
jgi:hypothetical protein